MGRRNIVAKNETKNYHLKELLVRVVADNVSRKLFIQCLCEYSYLFRCLFLIIIALADNDEQFNLI